MELPKRKPNRILEFDYSSPNAYFVTICTTGKKKYFWDSENQLSEYGKVVKAAIENIERHYSAVSVDHYVVMPNHVHLLLQLNTDVDGRRVAAPTVSTIINQMKGNASRQIGHSIWQKGFYDHVVRGDADYMEIWKYIEGNPAKWKEDKLYID
ncbi:MAG: transposase [Oscillospiraceae bacterium]|nr:transposase [Oscillospiraceae bacterium]